jgi:uncharacterized damage-inducible protein DinB
MIDILKDLIRHNAYANASLLRAIRQHQPAAEDADLRKLLHHINVANRHWFLLVLGEPFAVEHESPVPEFLEAVTDQYRETCDRELDWVSLIQEADLNRLLESAFLPGLTVSVGEAMIQVCTHSTAHRAECAMKLRELGGKAPSMDFILWLKERPSPGW